MSGINVLFCSNVFWRIVKMAPYYRSNKRAYYYHMTKILDSVGDFAFKAGEAITYSA